MSLQVCFRGAFGFDRLGFAVQCVMMLSDVLIVDCLSPLEYLKRLRHGPLGLAVASGRRKAEQPVLAVARA